MYITNNISEHSIFGDYESIENRVTASLLHIINVGGEHLLRHLLAVANDLLPDSEINVGTQICYQNGEKSVFDGVVSCNFKFTYIIESKVVAKALQKAQVDKYHDAIEDDYTRLIFITPDENSPSVIYPEDLWLNWTMVAEALRSYENEQQNDLLIYLIDQFILLLSNLNLYDKDWSNRVIIVGGSFGEQVALDFGFYICQNNRYFRRAGYIAFAHMNRIENLFRIVDGPMNNVDICKGGLVSNDYFTKYPHKPGILLEYFKLEWVEKLNITNDRLDKNGRRCAFVQRQTYTTYDKIINAKKTSEL